MFQKVISFLNKNVHIDADVEYLLTRDLKYIWQIRSDDRILCMSKTSFRTLELAEKDWKESVNIIKTNW